MFFTIDLPFAFVYLYALQRTVILPPKIIRFQIYRIRLILIYFYYKIDKIVSEKSNDVRMPVVMAGGISGHGVLLCGGICCYRLSFHGNFMKMIEISSIA